MLDVTKLSDNEVGFLHFAAEQMEVARSAREHGYKSDFVADGEKVEQVLYKEFHRRKLSYKGFTSGE